MKLLNLIVGGLVFLSLVGCGKTSNGSAYPDIEMLKKAAAIAYVTAPHHPPVTNISTSGIRINQQYRDGNRAYIKYDCLFDATLKSNGEKYIFGGMSGVMEFLKSDDDGHWVFVANTISSSM